MENIIYVKKFISDEYRIMRSINMEIFLINDAITYFYKNLNSGDLEFTKDIFKRLHFYKVKKYYLYIKLYNFFVKRSDRNEKLLKHFEFVLLSNRFQIPKVIK